MTPKAFTTALIGVKFENVFNPYSDRCDVYDSGGAATTRTHNLLKVLKKATESDIEALWIGRDLGYRGGRRSGLALTDDVHLSAHGARWDVRLERATTGPVMVERTARVIWGVLETVAAPVFLWNVFPFHPHEPDEPFSNRAHTVRERMVGEELLAELIRMIRPRRLVAIGNDAAKSACRLARSLEAVQVRHPSYGGQRDFIKQIRYLHKSASSPTCMKTRLMQQACFESVPPFENTAPL